MGSGKFVKESAEANCTCAGRFTIIDQRIILRQGPHDPKCPANASVAALFAVPWQMDAQFSTNPAAGNPAASQPEDMPQEINDANAYLRKHSQDWQGIFKLAELHERLNWYPNLAPAIRLRRVRNQLAICFRFQARKYHRAAAELFYRHEMWKDKAPKHIVKYYYDLLNTATRHDRAAQSLSYDDPNYWPLMARGGVIVCELLERLPGIYGRLLEEGDTLDQEIYKEATLLLDRQWFPAYEGEFNDEGFPLSNADDEIEDEEVEKTFNDMVNEIDREFNAKHAKQPVQIKFVPKPVEESPKVINE